MALYVTRPRRDEVRIGRGLPSGSLLSEAAISPSEIYSWGGGGGKTALGENFTFMYLVCRNDKNVPTVSMSIQWKAF